MNKKLTVIVILLCCFKSLSAQQRPQYTQYIFNNYILNPAITGIENYIDVKAGYRNQWQGLTDAPVTSYISVHAPIGKQFTQGSATSFSGEGNNPMNRSFVQTYKASEPHHGVGFHLVSDKIGPFVRTDFNFTYAYHLGLTQNMNLAVGVAAGVSRIALDRTKIILEDPSDPAIGMNAESQIQPDLGAGIWLYGPRYFAGVSAQQLLGKTISFSDNTNYNLGKQQKHFFMTAGYKIYLGDDIAAIPSVMFKVVSPAPVSIDLNTKIAFQDKFWVGASYRKDDSFAALAGLNVGHFFNMSYSYDFTTSELRSVTNGTHEIVIGLLLNNRYKVTCPQRNW
ncbi:MAG: type IX secretion system membrane protein PorP/SprF [Flavobacterium sp.]|nr:type IX secretion system membrane protein PorP/SprF [Pedobacter sp.]